MSKSTPVGYKHDWSYRGHWSEQKKKKGLWNFVFRATKRTKAKSFGSFGKGTKGAWKINGIQYIRKSGLGKYETKLVGTKKPLKFYVKKPRYSNGRK